MKPKTEPGILSFPRRMREWKARHWMLIALAVGFEWVGGLIFESRIDSQRVYGYIDPGTGALVFQALVAAFFGFLFFARSARKAVVRFFKRLFGRTVQEESESQPTKRE